jgi:hypothetical protein
MRQPSGESRTQLDADPMRFGAVTKSIDQGGKYAVLLRLHEDDVSGQGLAVARPHVGS